ncbi:MAG: ABC transporter substrate-binding protein [Pseudomonadales bacterium]|nr:ABC transporter substrate-binding protein [Pseudomonadales bacterium]
MTSISVFKSRSIFSTVLLCFCFVASGVAAAQGLDSSLLESSLVGPKPVVEDAAKRLTTKLTQEKSAIEKSPELVKQFVEQELLPIFDAKLMSRLVMSSSWKQASKDEQEAFTLAFRNILIKTYSNAFAAYDGQELEFKAPIFNKTHTKAIVRSRILQKKKMPILVDYRLRKVGQGWLVYDAVIEGVGVVKSYRSQIKEKVDEKGIALMIKDIEMEACGDKGCRAG